MEATTKTKYQIKVGDQFVGAYRIGQLELVPASHGYIYDTEADAQSIAAGFEGAEVIPWIR